MAKRNEHVIAIMLEAVSLGSEFVEWPLHITIVPWFPCNSDKILDSILENIAKRSPPFSVEAGVIRYFGAMKNVKVNIVKKNDQLSKLHQDVLNQLEANGFGIHQKEYVGNGYRPHITHQPHGHAKGNQRFAVNAFTLVRQNRLKKTGVMVKAAVKNYELGQ